MEKHHQRLGRAGEDVAACFLRAQGHRILARNWRCASGELDLISELEGQVIAVEVKTRTTSKFGTAFEAISPEKYARIQRLIVHWAQHSGWYLPRLRIDVICVNPALGGWRIEHHRQVEP